MAVLFPPTVLPNGANVRVRVDSGGQAAFIYTDASGSGEVAGPAYVADGAGTFSPASSPVYADPGVYTITYVDVTGAQQVVTVTLTGTSRPSPQAPSTASATYVQRSLDGQPRLQTTALQAWHAALANRDNSPATICTMADSIGEGMGASTYKQRWISRLGAVLRSRFPTTGITGGGENYLPLAFKSASLAPVFTVAGSPTVNDTFGLGLRSYILTGAGQSFTGTLTGTSFDILVTKGTSTGTLSVTVDGGGAQTFSTASGGGTVPGQLIRVTMGASGAHTVVISWGSGGSIFIAGVVVYDGDESKGIHVIDGGHSGLWTRDFLGTGSITLSGGLPWIYSEYNTFQPSLFIIELGVNDWAHNVSSATVQTNLTSLITNIRANVTSKPSIVLVPVYDIAINNGFELWSNYVSKMQALAAADTGGIGGASAVTVFDMTQRMPLLSSDVFGLYYDTVHPSNKGHAMIADALASFISPR